MKPRFSFARARLDKIRKESLYRRLLWSRVSGPNIFVGKRKLVNLSSNDYLGLGKTKTYRSQMQSSSRLISGNDEVFEKLESELARHKFQQSSLVFPTGYMANLGMISILPQKGDLILSDELNHASIIDSCKLSAAKKMVYKHNDLDDLETKMKRKGRCRFVVTEGVFSMNGDFSKLQEITRLCKKHDATLIVDDAHGDFVLGHDGQGTASYLGVHSKVDVYISSLSKGLGAFGGYAASSRDIIDLAINTSRPFIYTSALPNLLAKVALDRLSSNMEKKRAKLWKNIHSLRCGLESFGYSIDSKSQIIPIIVGDEKKALEFGMYIFNNGIFAQPIRFPTVGRGSARVRISVTAWLSDADIARSLDVFERAGKIFGIT